MRRDGEDAGCRTNFAFPRGGTLLAMGSVEDAMHKIIDDVIHLSLRDAGVVLDHASARLAVVVVVDHLPGVLDREELGQLEGALPLMLSLMLQRSASVGHGRFALVDPLVVDVICAVLARFPVSDALARRLRGPVAIALGGGVVEVRDEDLASRPTRREMRAVCRPTVRVMTHVPERAFPPAVRPTARAIRAA